MDRSCICARKKTHIRLRLLAESHEDLKLRRAAVRYLHEILTVVAWSCQARKGPLLLTDTCRENTSRTGSGQDPFVPKCGESFCYMDPRAVEQGVKLTCYQLTNKDLAIYKTKVSVSLPFRLDKGIELRQARGTPDTCQLLP